MTRTVGAALGFVLIALFLAAVSVQTTRAAAGSRAVAVAGR